VQELNAQGAAVVALDISSSIQVQFSQPDIAGVVCDVTDEGQIQDGVAEAVRRFGGLDILVSNAGAFYASETIDVMGNENWDSSLDVNLTSHQRLLKTAAPFLKLGVDPAVIMIASKNVPAPGPGAAAYSVAKAGQTQLARVAALELGKHGVRVNTLHPDAVFDTSIWTPEVLTKRAEHYGITVEEYKTKNILRTEICARDVAALACAMAGPLFFRTTGAQLPIDGGNDRVI
jgi:NAD(P)-dependent dehydrogenase (short-subunit alcohol dehydrogenase family)